MNHKFSYRFLKMQNFLILTAVGPIRVFKENAKELLRFPNKKLRFESKLKVKTLNYKFLKIFK